MEAWIRRVLRYQASGIDVVLTGQSPLGEVLASPSATELDGIAACLVDVDDEVRWQRLAQRDPGRWDLDARRAFLGWARWHRGHAADPRYHPEVIKPGWAQLRWDRWSAWTGADPRWTVDVVDTTDRTVAQSAADLQQWIMNVRSQFAGGQLALASGWATVRRG